MGVSFAGHDCLDPRALYRDCLAMRLSVGWASLSPNCFRCPLGPEPGEGWLLLSLRSLKAIDPALRFAGLYDLAFTPTHLPPGGPASPPGPPGGPVEVGLAAAAAPAPPRQPAQASLRPGSSPGEAFAVPPEAEAAAVRPSVPMAGATAQPPAAAAAGPAGRVTLKNLCLIAAEALTWGADADLDRPYLARVADRRHVLARQALDAGYNVLDPSTGGHVGSTLDGGEPWSWDGMLADLWGACGLGDWPGLGFSPDGIPENIECWQAPALAALCGVLRRLGCDLRLDPTADAFGVVRLGAEDEAHTQSLQRWRPWRHFDPRTVSGINANSPKTVRVVFRRSGWSPADGSLYYAVDVPSPDALPDDPATLAVTHDEMAALGGAPPSNLSDLQARAAQRAADLLRRLAAPAGRLTYPFPLAEQGLLPGARVRAARWSDAAGLAAPEAGMITEVELGSGGASLPPPPWPAAAASGCRCRPEFLSATRETTAGGGTLSGWSLPVDVPAETPGDTLLLAWVTSSVSDGATGSEIVPPSGWTELAAGQQVYGTFPTAGRLNYWLGCRRKASPGAETVTFASTAEPMNLTSDAAATVFVVEGAGPPDPTTGVTHASDDTSAAAPDTSFTVPRDDSLLLYLLAAVPGVTAVTPPTWVSSRAEELPLAGGGGSGTAAWSFAADFGDSAASLSSAPLTHAGPVGWAAAVAVLPPCPCLGEAAGGGSYTDEEAQDAVGSILADSSTIDFTYDDAVPSVTAAVKDASLGTSKLGGDITAAGRALLDDADAAAQRTTLGLGSAATYAHTAFDPAGSASSALVSANSYTDGEISGLSSVYQPLDGDLTAIAALAGTNTIYYRSGSNTWSAVTVGSGLTFSGGTLSAPAIGDGDKGDITVSSSGTVWTIDSNVISTFGRSLIDDAGASDARTTLGLGTSATVNTGTSGATIPLLNGANTWSSTQTFENNRLKITNAGGTAEITLTASSSATTASRSVSIGVNDGSRALNLNADLTVSATATVSGTNTGDQTSVTGNAGTATALQTARTIGGVSFDGTANIVPQTIESANEATDTTCFLLFITQSGTQQLQPKNNTGLTYNSSTNALGVTTIELGHANDTTLARSSAGNVSIEGNVVYRAGGTDVPVADGGTGASSLTAYAVLCGGTTSTGAIQSVASVGTAGQVLTSAGAGALPTMSDPITATSGETVGSSYTISAASGTYAATGITFTLPSAGKYKVVAQVRGEVQPATTGTHHIVAKLYNTTDAADVTNSETMVVLSAQNGVNVNLTACVSAEITVAGSKSFEIYAKRTGTSFTSSQLVSDTNGRTKVNWHKIGP